MSGLTVVQSGGYCCTLWSIVGEIGALEGYNLQGFKDRVITALNSQHTFMLESETGRTFVTHNLLAADDYEIDMLVRWHNTSDHAITTKQVADTITGAFLDGFPQDTVASWFDSIVSSGPASRGGFYRNTFFEKINSDDDGLIDRFTFPGPFRGGKVQNSTWDGHTTETITTGLANNLRTSNILQSTDSAEVGTRTGLSISDAARHAADEAQRAAGTGLEALNAAIERLERGAANQVGASLVDIKTIVSVSVAIVGALVFVKVVKELKSF